MKAGIHPNYTEATVLCACGNTWTTRSTRQSLRTDLCNVCHPFYTGEQRIVDTAGQVERFMKKLETASATEQRVSKRQQRLDDRNARLAEERQRQEEAAKAAAAEEAAIRKAERAARAEAEAARAAAEAELAAASAGEVSEAVSEEIAEQVAEAVENE